MNSVASSVCCRPGQDGAQHLLQQNRPADYVIAMSKGCSLHWSAP